jgi:DNA-3-methyladenine glycosylase I
MQRCWWCGDDPLYQAYHDHEWGFPVYDDRLLFEKLSLEGFQAGLSWLTILKKRENFREAFHGFDIEMVARMDDADVEKLLTNSAIVRHRGKIEAVLHNARLVQLIQKEEGSFADFIWRYAPKAHSRPHRITEDVARQLTQTKESQQLAGDLKKRGFRFFGPTTAYAFMQAMGLVNDHVEGCFVRSHIEQVKGL